MFLISSGLTQLNSSLDNIDIRYTTANGAEWSPRGAGTWSPFSSMAFKDFFSGTSVWGGGPQSYVGALYNVIKSDGTFDTHAYGLDPTVTVNDDYLQLEIQTLGSSGVYYKKITITALADGYYLKYYQATVATIAYYSAGDTIVTNFRSGDTTNDGTYYAAYLGTSNPFE